MTHIYNPTSGNDDQRVGGSYAQGQPKYFESSQIDVVGGNSGTPFTICCDQEGGGGGDTIIISSGGGAVSTFTAIAGGVYQHDDGLGTTTDIDFNLQNNGDGTISLLGSSSTETSSVNICSIVTSYCNVATNMVTGANAYQFRLRDGQGDTLSTINIPNHVKSVVAGASGFITVTNASGSTSNVNVGNSTWTNQAGGVYRHANGFGTNTDIDYNLSDEGGGVLGLRGSANALTSTIDIGAMAEAAIQYGASLTLSNNDTIALLDQDAGTLSSITLQNNVIKYTPAISAVPTSVPTPASHHFWLMDTDLGNIDFTPSVDGQLGSVISGATDADQFHFVNNGSGQLTFTAAEGYTYTFNEGDVLTLVRVTGTNEYRII